MSGDSKKTAWMWLSGDALRGLSVDRDKGTLTWIWQAGCHCADEDELLQTVEQFETEGAPSLVGPLPEDIEGEVRAVLLDEPIPA
jgi:hypothetical protein